MVGRNNSVMTKDSMNDSNIALLESTIGSGHSGSLGDESDGLENGGGNHNTSLSNDLALFLSNPKLKSALADGSLDLTSYSQTMEEEIYNLERECINHYRESEGDLVKLKQELEECDSILGHFQELLLGFQADLSGLSGDIRHLQDQSRTLGVKLRNRKHAELGIRQYLQRSLLEPSLADTICRASVDANFVGAVLQMERKYQITSMPQEDGETQIPSSVELKQHLYKLRLVATSRVRSYFLSKIAETRRPKTNVRMIQQNSLLKYVPLMEFLLEAAPDFYAEVKDVYVESMGKTLHALFRTYAAQLMRLLDVIATRQDVLAMDEANLRDNFTNKINFSKRTTDSFHLGSRANLLEQSQALLHSNDPNTVVTCNPIVAYVALAEKKRYPYEQIFHSYMMHLVDAVTNEYLFCRQFFRENGPDIMPIIFQKTLSLVLEQLENYLFTSYDSLALLIMIKLTHFYKRLLSRRNINYLDKFLEKVTNLLWPRLKTIMDKHLRSIRDADPKKLLRTDNTSMITQASNKNNTMHAHYISRRYAEFTCSILQILHQKSTQSSNKQQQVSSNTLTDEATRSPLKSDANNDNKKAILNLSPKVQAQRESAGELLLNDLETMQKEIVVLLERLSETQSQPKHRIVFLINNYDLILSIFQERRREDYLDKFAALLMQQRELFVEQELLHTFSKMIAFVQQTEQYMASSGNSGIKDQVNLNVVETLVSEFSSTWKQGIQLINANVLTYFSNFRNGMEILKQVLTQLLLYYTRFQDLLRKIWRNNKHPPFAKDLVPTSLILTEIKKYALAI